MCVFLIQGNIAAAQYIEMDQTAVISVSLSSSNHNRIGIIGDRIKKAFFNGSNISVDVEEESGQLFIQSVRPNCPNTTLSIVSVSGAIQDLELSFTESSSEIVLLRPEFGIEPETVKNSDDVCCSPEGFDLTKLAESVVNGNIPEGYTSYEDQDEPTKIKNGLKIQRVSRYVNDKQIVFLYRLHNDTKKPKEVTECQVNVLDGDWVFLDRYKLKPNECALVLIGCFR